jgi:serine/threonine protein kinase
MAVSGSRTIGSFAIERELGAGGMGLVLLGRHTALDRLAVLKRLRPELCVSEELVERFAREARAAAAVHHQNVVAVYDWIGLRGEHYIAQEYVDGVDLGAALVQVGRFPWRVAALIALELTRGLEAIHARGTVHRDLKPANVLLGRAGEVKIADFGIAIEATSDGLTRPGTTLGTPPYMAPEQLLGERVDARSDLFALGVVLYEMLAGTPPHREGEMQALLTRLQRERYEPIRKVASDVPRWLARLVRGLLRGKARARPASAQRVRQTLERRLDAFPAEAKLELASWLWGEGIFQPREGDTVVLPSESPGLGPHRWRRTLLAGSVACLLATVSTCSLSEPSRSLVERAWTLAVSRAPSRTGPVAKLDPGESRVMRPSVASPEGPHR